MTLSARNQLRGTVKSVVLGSVMAEVVVDATGDADVAALATTWKAWADRVRAEPAPDHTTKPDPKKK